MSLARVEVLHERRWNLVGCLSPQRRHWSACIIDGIAWGGTTPEVMQAVAVPKPHITPRMSGQVNGYWKYRGSSIHLRSVEVERWNSDALRHPIAAISEEVEQYFETPNQALISLPWTSSKKSSVSFVCIDRTESIMWLKEEQQREINGLV